MSTTQHYMEEERELLRLLLEKEGVNSKDWMSGQVEAPKRLPLSYAQKRLWFLDHLLPANDFYNVVLACELRGALNIPALERSLQEIVRRHGALRTRFVMEDGEPVQKIEPSVEFQLRLLDLSHEDRAGGRRKQAEEVFTTDGAKPFDLRSAPLLRGTLIRMNEEEYALGLTIHHIVVDEWSLAVLMQEMGILYTAYVRGQESPLQEMPMQYADYTLWQAECLKGELFARQLEYWKQQLSGMPEVLELPIDKPRPVVTHHRGSMESREIGRELWEGLKRASRQEGASMFMTLLAVFEVLLLRYTGQEDFGVGTPVANRNHVRMESVIGFCLNTLVMRADLRGRPSFRQVLERVRRTALEGYSHQDLPLEKLVEELSPERRLSHTPLFQVMFTSRSETNPDLTRSLAATLMGPDVQLRSMELKTATAKYDLTLMSVEAECPLVALNYDTCLFEAETIQRMLSHYERLLAAAIGMENGIWDMPMLTEAEIQQLLVEWNRTEAKYERRAIHELFEEQVKKNPDWVAVQSEGQQLTYDELNRQSNQLARRLRKLGVGPEMRVGLCVERNPQMVVGMLGILKAGGAYVPLDTAYPADRLKFMVQDAAIAVLVTQGALLNWLPEMQVQRIRLDEDLGEISCESVENVVSRVDRQNLAYVIYTSGSSGKPKGVAIEHGSASVLLQWARDIFSAEELSGVLASTSICFDLSVFEIFAPLCWGGKAIIVRDALSLAEMEQGFGVKLLNTVPSAMTELLRIKGVPPAVKTINLAGEALQPSIVRQLYDELKVERVFNLYGPSEDTTYSTYACLKQGEANGRVPIGRPISNTQAYVLDKEHQPVPVGCMGELYLGGKGVARGYLNRPELTAERFIPNPFSVAGGERIYRTGDQVRWGRDGKLEFLRRLDQQVKIRGYRIELGEIEAALNEHAEVAACAVVVREDQPGDRRLVAYVVKTGAIDDTEIREFVKERLPEYMIPTAVIHLEKLPLTLNGKLDRNSLPAPEGPGTARKAYVGPRNGEEELLCGLFAEVLNVESLGVHDNFFAVGGHSLLATRLLSRIRETMGVEVALRSVFEFPTVAELAVHLRIGAGLSSARRKTTGRTPLRAEPRPPRLPLSYAQQWIWFEDRIQGQRSEYNLLEALRWRGELDCEALAGALDAIVSRHEMLRTHFAESEDGQPIQIIEPNLHIALPVEDIGASDRNVRQVRIAAVMREEREYKFDLSQGPLLRMRLLKLDEQEYILLRNSHHIVSDAWSAGIFNRELLSAYEALHQGRALSWEPLTVQYADFALWQRRCLDEVMAEQLDYWKKQLAGIPGELALPRDRPRPAQRTFEAAACATILPAELAGQLRKLGQQNQATLYITLLSTFALLLHHYSGQDDIVLASPIANRSEAQLEKLIGLFANPLALRVRIDSEAKFSDLLARVRATALDAYSHQDLPFVCLLEELSPGQSLNRNPICQVMFVWHYLLAEVPAFQGLELAPVEVEGPRTSFDVELHAVERAGAVHLQWTYNRALFDRWRIEQMAQQFELLLRSVVAMPDRPLREFTLSKSQEHAVPPDADGPLKNLPEELC